MKGLSFLFLVNFRLTFKKHASFTSGFRPQFNTRQASDYFLGCLLSKMAKLVRIFRQLRFLQELETGKFGGGGSTRDNGLITVDTLFENPARYTYSPR